MFWRNGSNSTSNINDIQSSLFSEAISDRHKKFKSLKKLVVSDTVLKAAWKRVKTRKETAGVDGLTVRDIEKTGAEKFITQVSSELKKGKYTPSNVKRIFIPKASGNLRPIGILTVKDRLVQSALKLILDPIFEADFKDCSFGFRHQLSARHATLEVYKWLELGDEYILETDIAHCFDCIPHEKLINMIKTRIKDRFIISLIQSWLKTGIVEHGKTVYPEKGILQGGVISPLLCNIYLDQFDRHFSDFPFKEKPETTAHLVRYADDLVILSKKPIPLEYIENLLENLELEMKKEKTRTVRSYNGFEFLGCFFKKHSHAGITWIGMYPGLNSVDRLKEKIEEITDLRLVTTCPVEKMMQNVNSAVKGWLNYYLHTFYKKPLVELESFYSTRIKNYIRVYSYIYHQ